MDRPFNFQRLQGQFVKLDKLGIHSLKDLTVYEDEVIENIVEGFQQLHQLQEAKQLFCEPANSNFIQPDVRAEKGKPNKFHTLLFAINELFPDGLPLPAAVPTSKAPVNINNALSKSAQTDFECVTKNSIETQTSCNLYAENKHSQTDHQQSEHVNGHHDQDTGDTCQTTPDAQMDDADQNSSYNQLVTTQTNPNHMEFDLSTDSVQAAVEPEDHIADLDESVMIISDNDSTMDEVDDNNLANITIEVVSREENQLSVAYFANAEDNSSRRDDQPRTSIENQPQDHTDHTSDDTQVDCQITGEYDRAMATEDKEMQTETFNVKSPGAPVGETRLERRKRKDRERHAKNYEEEKKKRKDSQYAENCKVKWKNDKRKQRANEKKALAQKIVPSRKNLPRLLPKPSTDNNPMNGAPDSTSDETLHQESQLLAGLKMTNHNSNPVILAAGSQTELDPNPSNEPASLLRNIDQNVIRNETSCLDGHKQPGQHVFPIFVVPSPLSVTGLLQQPGESSPSTKPTIKNELVAPMPASDNSLVFPSNLQLEMARTPVTVESTSTQSAMPTNSFHGSNNAIGGYINAVNSHPLQISGGLDLPNFPSILQHMPIPSTSVHPNTQINMATLPIAPQSLTGNTSHLPLQQQDNITSWTGNMQPDICNIQRQDDHSVNANELRKASIYDPPGRGVSGFQGPPGQVSSIHDVIQHVNMPIPSTSAQSNIPIDTPNIPGLLPPTQGSYMNDMSIPSTSTQSIIPIDMPNVSGLPAPTGDEADNSSSSRDLRQFVVKKWTFYNKVFICDIAVMDSGDVVYCDMAHIRMLDTDGRPMTVPYDTRDVRHPQCVAVSRQTGHVVLTQGYLSEGWFVYTRDGDTWSRTTHTMGGKWWSTCVTWTVSGDVVMGLTDFIKYCLVRYDVGGREKWRYDIDHDVIDIAMDSQDNIYVCNADYIQVYSPEGSFNTTLFLYTSRHVVSKPMSVSADSMEKVHLYNPERTPQSTLHQYTSTQILSSIRSVCTDSRDRLLGLHVEVDKDGRRSVVVDVWDRGGEYRGRLVELELEKWRPTLRIRLHNDSTLVVSSEEKIYTFNMPLYDTSFGLFPTLQSTYESTNQTLDPLKEPELSTIKLGKVKWITFTNKYHNDIAVTDSGCVVYRAWSHVVMLDADGRPMTVPYDTRDVRQPQCVAVSRQTGHVVLTQRLLSDGWFVYTRDGDTWSRTTYITRGGWEPTCVTWTVSGDVVMGLEDYSKYCLVRFDVGGREKWRHDIDYNALDIAMDSQDNIYVCNDDYIQVYSPEGSFNTTLNLYTSRQVVSKPMSVSADSMEKVHLYNPERSPQSTPYHYTSTQILSNICSVCTDSRDRLLVLHVEEKYRRRSVVVSVWDRGGEYRGRLVELEVEVEPNEYDTLRVRLHGDSTLVVSCKMKIYTFNMPLYDTSFGLFPTLQSTYESTNQTLDQLKEPELSTIKLGKVKWITFTNKDYHGLAVMDSGCVVYCGGSHVRMLDADGRPMTVPYDTQDVLKPRRLAVSRQTGHVVLTQWDLSDDWFVYTRDGDVWNRTTHTTGGGEPTCVTWTVSGDVVMGLENCLVRYDLGGREKWRCYVDDDVIDIATDSQDNIITCGYEHIHVYSPEGTQQTTLSLHTDTQTVCQPISVCTDSRDRLLVLHVEEDKDGRWSVVVDVWDRGGKYRGRLVELELEELEVVELEVEEWWGLNPRVQLHKDNTLVVTTEMKIFTFDVTLALQKL